MSASKTNPRKQNNVVFIMTDTQSWFMVGAYGDPSVDTPNLDRLAARGTRFDRAYTTCPLCTPARAGLFTGLLPQHAGAWCNELAVQRNIPLMGEIFRGAGYRAAYTGKWHLDGAGYFGTGKADGGFEPEWWYDGQDYRRRIGDEMFGAYLNVRSVEDLRRANFSEENCWGHHVAGRAIDFLEEAGDEPFILCVSFDEPHGPCVAPPEYWEGFPAEKVPYRENYFAPVDAKPALQRLQRKENGEMDWGAFTRNHAKLYACNSYIDREIGRVVDAVERLHGDDTVIIYTSDHGDHAGAHGLWAKGPTMYEETTHVPLILRMPGQEEGQTCDAAVSHLDVLPTMLDLCGLTSETPLHGKGLLPLLAAPTGQLHEHVSMSYSGFGKGFSCYGAHYPIRTVVDGRHKLAINLYETDELYDLEEDPYEMTNRIDEPDYAAIRDALHDRLLEEMEALKDPFRSIQWANRRWRPNTVAPFFYYPKRGSS